MRSDQVYALSVQVEKEGLTGAGEEELLADDIFSVLEYLQDEGVDLTPLLRKNNRERSGL
jgi:hypothetical protein